MGENLIKVPRLSRIYYQGKFYNYPLSLSNTLSNLGILTSGLMGWSYFRAKLKALIKRPEPETFEEWVTHCFGERLYKTFFKSI